MDQIIHDSIGHVNYFYLQCIFKNKNPQRTFEKERDKIDLVFRKVSLIVKGSTEQSHGSMCVETCVGSFRWPRVVVMKYRMDLGDSVREVMERKVSRITTSCLTCSLCEWTLIVNEILSYSDPYGVRAISRVN